MAAVCKTQEIKLFASKIKMKHDKIKNKFKKITVLIKPKKSYNMQSSLLILFVGSKQPDSFPADLSSFRLFLQILPACISHTITSDICRCLKSDLYFY